jgi:hypothetical protein
MGSLCDGVDPPVPDEVAEACENLKREGRGVDYRQPRDERWEVGSQRSLGLQDQGVAMDILDQGPNESAFILPRAPNTVIDRGPDITAAG